jgi:hypothetical protein
MSCEITVRSVAPLYQCQPGTQATSIINEPINPDWRPEGFTIHCGLSGVGCEHPPCTATGFGWNGDTGVLGYTIDGVRYEIKGKKGKVYHTTSQNLNPFPEWRYYQRSDTVRAMGGWTASGTNKENTVGGASGDQQSSQGGSSTLKPSETEEKAQEGTKWRVNEEPCV